MYVYVYVCYIFKKIYIKFLLILLLQTSTTRFILHFLLFSFVTSFSHSKKTASHYLQYIYLFVQP